MPARPVPEGKVQRSYHITLETDEFLRRFAYERRVTKAEAVNAFLAAGQALAEGRFDLAVTIVSDL